MCNFFCDLRVNTTVIGIIICVFLINGGNIPAVVSVQHGIQLQGHILLQCLLDEPGMHFSYIRLLWIMLLYGTVTLGRLLLIETDTVNLTVDDFKHADLLSIDDLANRKNHISLEDVNKHRSDIRGLYRSRVRRNGVSRAAKLWPAARIPYAISPHYNAYERALLARAIKQYHEKTCIRFVPRGVGENDYLFIGKVDGCFSEVGRTNGVQVLSLDNGCMEYSTIIHEMMHVVGFYHEHERWDRDNYIDIIWQNVDRGALDQFGKVDLSKTSYYGQPYDYHSILHYDSLAFSKNGFPTMLPKKKGLASTIGNAKDFSDIDLAKINRMYACPLTTKEQVYTSRIQSSPTYTAGFVNADRLNAPLKSYSNDAQHQRGEKSSEKACEDRITVCWWTQDRCLAPSVYVMMRSLCAKTCNFCT